MEEILELIMDIKAILNHPTTKENIIENQSGYTTVLDDDPFRRSSNEVFSGQKPFNPPQFQVPWEETNKTLENFCKTHVAAKTKNKNNQEIQEEDCRAGERNESKFSNVMLDGENLLDSDLPEEKDIDIISKHSDNISQQQHRYDQEGNNDRVLKRKKTKIEVEEMDSDHQSVKLSHAKQQLVPSQVISNLKSLKSNDNLNENDEPSEKRAKIKNKNYNLAIFSWKGKIVKSNHTRAKLKMEEWNNASGFNYSQENLFSPKPPLGDEWGSTGKLRYNYRVISKVIADSMSSPFPILLSNDCHYAVACVEGLKGKMEDTHKAATFNISPLPNSTQSESQIPFFGVFDGHGGRKAAKFAAENVGQNIVDTLLHLNLNLSRSKDVEYELKKKNIVEEAVRSGYLKTDEEFLRQTTNILYGSTCVTALIIDENLVVSNAGDSRAVISRLGEAKALTRDHKVGDKDKRERIKNLGGCFFHIGGVWLVQGSEASSRGLAVPREIGDTDFKKFISAEPETIITQITSDYEFLILATDGLWDVVSNQEAVDISHPFCLQDQLLDANGKQSGSALAACQNLVELALGRKSEDDITIMIVQLSHFCCKEREESVGNPSN